MGKGFFNPNVASADWAEVECFSRCLTWAKNKGWANIASIINKINSSCEDITVLGFMVRQCKQTLLDLNNCKVAWCNRTCNKVADFLSQLSLQNSCNFFFDLDYPSEIQNLIIKDSVE